ncbi:phage tail sheath C-terminal domain-containing protein [Streptomyces sp. NPDC049577]|uniref:phage tail sheath family protein n=1 Tax=Streptomyces sp. NPDC049577 TaxID=3155153 RepID=UPI00342626A5
MAGRPMPNMMVPGTYIWESVPHLYEVTAVPTAVAAFLGKSKEVASGKTIAWWSDSFTGFHRWLATQVPAAEANAVAAKLARDGDTDIAHNIEQHFAGSGDQHPLTEDAIEELRAGIGIGKLKTNTMLFHSVYAFFANGGHRCLTILTSESEAGYENAIAALTEHGDVTIVAAPEHGHDPVLAQQLTEHCADMGNRMAILQLPGEATEKTAVAPNVKPAEYAAAYFPWIHMPMPGGAPDPVTGRVPTVRIPPCGHVAGAWSASDREKGVFYAPANVPLAAVASFTAPLSEAQQSDLLIRTKGRVNCLRSIPGLGPMVWGARTLDPDVNRRYVNVRRLMNFLEASIKASTRWAVFQPVDQHLWGALRGQVGSFLHDQWLSGALRGDVASDAFRVVCDASNNPAGSIAAGKVIVDIAVAPVRPAEFILFRITQTAGPVSELVHPGA